MNPGGPLCLHCGLDNGRVGNTAHRGLCSTCFRDENIRYRYPHLRRTAQAAPRYVMRHGIEVLTTVEECESAEERDARVDAHRLRVEADLRRMGWADVDETQASRFAHVVCDQCGADFRAMVWKCKDRQGKWHLTSCGDCRQKRLQAKISAIRRKARN